MYHNYLTQRNTSRSESDVLTETEKKNRSKGLSSQAHDIRAIGDTLL